MRFLPEFLRPSRVYKPRTSEMSAAQALPADTPFLPPNIDLTFFYGVHDTRRDFEPLAPLLLDADIFIPESPYWKMSHIAFYSRISQGDRRAQKEWEAEEGQKANGFTDAQLKAFLGSNIRITVIDYPASDSKSDQIQSHFENWGLLDKVVPSWNQTLDNIVNFARVEADLENYRERGMLRCIGPRLLALITEDPELSQRERLKVVVQQGEAHSFYYPKFEALAAQTDLVTIRPVFRGGEPALIEHFDQLAHTFREGGHATQQQRRELAMRALARVGLRFNAIPLVLRDSDRQGLLPKLPPPEEMVERFGADDIRRFHQKLVEANGQKVRR